MGRSEKAGSWMLYEVINEYREKKKSREGGYSCSELRKQSCKGQHTWKYGKEFPTAKMECTQIQTHRKQE